MVKSKIMVTKIANIMYNEDIFREVAFPAPRPPSELRSDPNINYQSKPHLRHDRRTHNARTSKSENSFQSQLMIMIR